MLAFEAATDWNRGIPCKIFKSRIKLYLFFSCYILLLNASNRLSEVRPFQNKRICWPMRQIQRETGESLVFFQNTNPKLCIMIIYLFFDLLDQRGYQRWNLLDISWKKCRAMWQLRPETGKSLVICFSKHW